MSETISGYQATLQTLSAGFPSVTITGTIEAAGSLTPNRPASSILHDAYGAVYGPSLSTETQFTVTNSGLVEDSFATLSAHPNAGIILGFTGTVDNLGIILSKTGSGIYLYEGGVASNAGTIIGGEEGIVFDSSVSPGTVDNRGLVETTLTPFTLSGGTGTYLSVGIDFDGTGIVENAATGTIDAQYGLGIFLFGGLPNYLTGTEDLAAATAINAGTITAAYGADFTGIGTFTNTGKIFTTHDGVELSVEGTLDNSGTILTDGAGAVSNGIASILNSGIIAATGTIQTVFTTTLSSFDTLRPVGIALLAGGIISNTSAGTISSDFGYGIDLTQGGTLINDGQVTGYGAGLLAAGEAFVTNSGTLAGTGFLLANSQAANFTSGVYLAGGGTFVNTQSGDVTGFTGLLGGSGTTLDNSGTIDGISSGIAVFFGGAGDRLIEHPGAVVTGSIEDNTGDGNLELTAGAAAGTLTSFSGFSTLAIDPGANWDFAGANSFAGTDSFLNNGTISERASDALTISADVAGTGVIILDPTTLTLNGSVAAGQQISFAGSGDVLALGDSNGFHGTISNFGISDSIILISPSNYTDVSFEDGVLRIAELTGTTELAFADPSTFVNGLVLSGGASIGTDITITAVTCFLAGTRIATPEGEKPVESLNIGDRIRTRHAGDQQIKWIGTRRYDGRFIQGNRAALPVCIRRNAIADDVPARDLWVSPGHAISIENVLIHASRLVNGVSVIQAQSVESVTYFHIELEDHQIIFAENCPAETFMDEHFRQQFQNAEEFRRLYPGGRAPRLPCQPRLTHGFELHAIQTRINARGGIAAPTVTGRLRGFVDQAGPDLCFGWAQDLAAPEAPVRLDIRAGGRLLGQVIANLYREDVKAAGLGSGYQGFEFTLPASVTGPIQVCRSTDRLGLPKTAARQRCA